MTAYPYNTLADEILSDKPEGILITDGPGNPVDNPTIIEQLRNFVGKLPMLGIGLGHQLLAMAFGAQTCKLPYGHRGGNQPVKDLQSGKTAITAQNHGYTVVSETLESAGGCLRYVNGNDGTCEGADYPKAKAFGVQFRPKGNELYSRFITMLGGND